MSRRAHKFAKALSLALVFAAVSSLAQDEPSPIPENLRAQENASYAAATQAYVDASVSEVQRLVPQLKGLMPATSQSDLAGLLEKVGARTVVLLQQLPDLIAREEVQERTEIGRGLRERAQKFNYLILVHRGAAATGMDEYRTDRQNRRIGAFGSDPRAPLAQGFAFAWTIFYPPMQSQSRFRYLGEQKSSGRNCFVVSFAQIPGSVRFPGQFRWAGKSVPILLQGIAWIQQSDYAIVRLRQDLLAPLPEVDLKKLATDIEFSEQHVPSTASTFWLPQSVELRQVQEGAEIESTRIVEVHSYSNYHRYEVEVKIGPSSN